MFIEDIQASADRKCRLRVTENRRGGNNEEWNTNEKIIFCPSPLYILSGMVGLEHVKELLLSGYLDCLPAPKESEQLSEWNLK